MEIPLLQTKLYIPPSHPGLVPRPRLIGRLDEGLQRKLTLISAPAGFGKTTLVSHWLHQSKVTAAWLSLDESDNDLTRFGGGVGLKYRLTSYLDLDADYAYKERDVHDSTEGEYTNNIVSVGATLQF